MARYKFYIVLYCSTSIRGKIACITIKLMMMMMMMVTVLMMFRYPWEWCQWRHRPMWHNTREDGEAMSIDRWTHDNRRCSLRIETSQHGVVQWCWIASIHRYHATCKTCQVRL